MTRFLPKLARSDACVKPNAKLRWKALWGGQPHFQSSKVIECTSSTESKPDYDIHERSAKLAERSPIRFEQAGMVEEGRNDCLRVISVKGLGPALKCDRGTYQSGIGRRKYKGKEIVHEAIYRRYL